MWETFFENLGTAMARFAAASGLPGTFLNLTILLVCSLLATWVISMLILRLILSKSGTKQGDDMLRMFFIRQAWYAASCVVAMIIIGLIVYFEFSDLFEYLQTAAPMFTELGLLIALIMQLALALIFLIGLGQQYERTKLRRIVSLPLTSFGEETAYLTAIRAFKKIKWLILIPVLGFLMFIPFRDKEYNNLVAVVLDSSTSMGGPIGIGKQALDQVLDKMYADTEVIVTVFEPNTGKNTFSDLINVTDMDSLAGNCQYFADKEGARAYVAGIEAENPDSPIMEATWKTFLFAEQSMEGRDFHTQILILVSDGMGIISATEGFDEFLCDQSGFNQIFSPEHVFLIHVGGGDATGPNSPAMFQEAISCGYEIREGTDQVLYAQALEEALKDVKGRGGFLTIWAAIFYCIFILIILLIRAKKLNTK